MKGFLVRKGNVDFIIFLSACGFQASAEIEYGFLFHVTKKLFSFLFFVDKTNLALFRTIEWR